MRVESYAFGRIRIEGREYTKDVVMLRGEVISPWWRSAGGHLFAPVDLEMLIDAAPEVVVLGTGYFGMVRIADETLKALEEAGTRTVVARTGPAVKEYNLLSDDGHDVAAAFHLTC